ncbi:hypothetical protein [Streptomyces sp. XD-27]|uniref:hypothetical protein n=1 Tax=Streptomyces sp. XD-27 TaxID=3062779 RepID=UPI0026F442A8|nr:hypothetical protein [Streptomyces sp. XD-27]WKX69057.1 hypothetical protein Q3Y56_03245 [Streptomyces sp. XD-27]
MLRHGMTRPVLLAIGVAAAVVTGACGDSGTDSGRLPAGPACVKSEADGRCLPLAPTGDRVDLDKPEFSRPTAVTNPLHPTGKVAQTLYGGRADGEPFRAEVTLLPGTKTITWNGERIDAVISQYVAYQDGRIAEVALDWYAQADDGSVWYLGEDVSNYEDGVVADTEGTWQAGKDGTAAMIMPAEPEVGDAYRPENIPGTVFEEVSVKAVDRTVPGPNGPVQGAITVEEIHQDSAREEKIFAPGYGEFSTGTREGDLEAVTLAVPTDAVGGPVPAELTRISGAADRVFDTAGTGDWSGASAAATTAQRARDTYGAGDVPAALGDQLSGAVDAMNAAVTARDADDARQSALKVAQADLDLQLRHRPPADIDAARLDLWTRQLLIDTAADDHGAVAGDVATLERIWDRVGHTVDKDTAPLVENRLRELRQAADDRDLAAVAESIPALRSTWSTLR